MNGLTALNDDLSWSIHLALQHGQDLEHESLRRFGFPAHILKEVLKRLVLLRQDCLDQAVLQVLRQLLKVLILVEVDERGVTDLILNATDRVVYEHAVEDAVFFPQADVVHEDFHLLRLLPQDLG